MHKDILCRKKRRYRGKEDIMSKIYSQESKGYINKISNAKRWEEELIGRICLLMRFKRDNQAKKDRSWALKFWMFSLEI